MSSRHDLQEDSDEALLFRLRTARSTYSYDRVRDQIVQEMLRRHERLIGIVTRQYRHLLGVDADDLLQQGRIGLLEAVDTFDPARKVPFIAFAAEVIKHGIQDSLAESRLIRVPRRERDLLRKIDEAEQEIQQEFSAPSHPEPATERVAQRLGIPEVKVRDALTRREQVSRITSLHTLNEERRELAFELLAPSDEEEEAERATPDFSLSRGEVFRRTALLAPLPKEHRTWALKRFWADTPRGSWARCERRWRERVWPLWLQHEDVPLTGEVVATLKQDLRDLQSPLRREHAAFAVWVMHAVPAVRARCRRAEEKLEELADEVMQRAVEYQDEPLYHIALSLWEGRDPSRFLAGKGRPLPPQFLRHIARHDPRNTNRVRQVFRRGVAGLDQSGNTRDYLFALWDAAGCLGDMLGSAEALRDELPSDLRRRWGHLEAINLSRTNAEKAVSQFLQALRNSDSRRYTTHRSTALGSAIAEILSKQSNHPAALLLRRAAAMMIRHVPDPALRLRLATQALRDDSAFVRHSSISSLRAVARQEEGYEVFDLLLSVLHTYEASDRRPEELMGNILQVLFLQAHSLDPECPQYQSVLRIYERLACDRHPRLRGQAISWLGELRRYQYPLDTLCVSLLQDTRPHEYATNIAQVLIAPAGLAEPNRLPEDFGTLAEFALPLGRTSY